MITLCRALRKIFDQLDKTRIERRGATGSLSRLSLRS
jgi:hypothetical protein